MSVFPRDWGKNQYFTFSVKKEKIHVSEKCSIKNIGENSFTPQYEHAGVCSTPVTILHPAGATG